MGEIMICLDRLHHESSQGYNAYRTRNKQHGHGLHKWLVLLAVLFSTSSNAIGAMRGPVAESSNVSQTEVNAAIAETVTVAMNVDQGPATYRATGFLHSFSPTAPGDDLVVPIKPRLFRMNASEVWAAYPRAKRLGARTQLVVSDSYGYSRFPGYNEYKSAWESTIAGLVAKADSLGFADIEWDLWNEPNFSQFWT